MHCDVCGTAKTEVTTYSSRHDSSEFDTFKMKCEFCGGSISTYYGKVFDTVEGILLDHGEITMGDVKFELGGDKYNLNEYVNEALEELGHEYIL